MPLDKTETTRTGTVTKQPAAYLESRVGSELVLMQVDDGRFHALKGVGLAIWHLLDETDDPDVIATRLVEAYEVPAATCESEVQAFLAQLKSSGLVVQT